MNKKIFIAPAVNVTAMETQNMICASVGVGSGTAENAQNNGWTLNSKKAVGIGSLSRTAAAQLGKLDF